MNESVDPFTDEDRASDSRADALSAILLVVIAVVTVVFWLNGQ